MGGLTVGNDGDYYGESGFGGLYLNGCDTLGCGSLFKITPGGDFTVLYQFDEINGSNPFSQMLQANDGNFYGTLYYGAFGNPNGSIFKMTPSGQVTTFHNMGGDGCCAYYATLIQATDGNIYGTTSAGGANNQGTVFSITLDGAYTTLHSFSEADGEQPFTGLTQSTNGKLYGTTQVGGTKGYGTIFSLDMGLKPFVAFVSPSGKVGDARGILGRGFTGTTIVSFNSTPASFTVASDTFIRATVPPGATNGTVTVTTPTGVLTSNVPFHVLR